MLFLEHVKSCSPSWNSGSEPLAALPYAEEVHIKNMAFANFWSEHRLPGKPDPLVEAPSPRRYRTTTKRRAFQERSGLVLGFADGSFEKNGLAQSLLEPESHQELYTAILQKVNQPVYRSLARALNWVIIRGDYEHFCVILNVAEMNASVVRKAKQMADFLQTSYKAVTAAWLYFDPSRSSYYLEADTPADGFALKHLFGPRLLTLVVDDLRLKYPPTVFSQVNEAMVPCMVAEARMLLEPRPKDRMLDLYCGYGLFGFSLGRSAHEVWGIELAGASIATAQETARRIGGHFHFLPMRITADRLRKTLPAPVESEVVLLDPPRQGAEAGVVPYLASRKPRRVLQICCGTEEVVPAVRSWLSSGYRLMQAHPLDLFAGTPNLETLLALEPQ
ncbi:MAG TPA: class I SAM-dependent RNA methyltransferase [Fibrobacteraceae bacterium]|nr:class I SAM-dependent RNA methyltransferase [Fibrobacteraceae bacterium]